MAENGGDFNMGNAYIFKLFFYYSIVTWCSVKEHDAFPANDAFSAFCIRNNMSRPDEDRSAATL